jgi:ABC-2 type transport system permease protein
MSASITLWHKHMTKFLANSEESFGLLIQPILWVVLFGTGMKSVMGGTIPGGEDLYMTSLVPGIVALSALGGAIAGGSTWLDERLRGIVKEYLVAPISRMSILLGNGLSIVTKALFQALVIFVVGTLMGAHISDSPLGWLGGVLLVGGYALGFAGVALAVASKVDSPGAYHSMIFILNLPLLFLSSALYPLSAVPTWMAVGARVNPTTYAIDGLRQTALRGGGGLGGELIPLWLCFLAVALFALLGTWVAYRAFKGSLG